MFSNEQCAQLVNMNMKGFENLLNALEIEVKKDDPDIKTIANIVGKMSQIYSLITILCGTFSGVDSRVGGFKEAAHVVKNMKDNLEKKTNGY